MLFTLLVDLEIGEAGLNVAKLTFVDHYDVAPVIVVVLVFLIFLHHGPRHGKFVFVVHFPLFLKLGLFLFGFLILFVNLLKFAHQSSSIEAPKEPSLWFFFTYFI